MVILLIIRCHDLRFHLPVFDVIPNKMEVQMKIITTITPNEVIFSGFSSCVHSPWGMKYDHTRIILLQISA